MAVSLAYPKELFHPNGFKTVSVYDADEDKAAQKSFADWRVSELDTAKAAREGKPAKPPAK